MNCSFVIKLPDGGNAYIPAKLSTLDDSSTFLEEFNAYKELKDRAVEEDEENLDKLKTAVREKIKTGLHPNTVSKYIGIASSADALVELINKEVQEQLNNSSLESAIYAFLQNNDFYKEGKYTPIEIVTKKGVKKQVTLEEFYRELSKPITKKYFKGINLENLKAGDNAVNVLEDISDKIEAHELLSVSTGSLKTLKTLVEKVFGRNTEFSKEKMFFNATFKDDENMSVVVIDETTEKPLIFYNDASDLSLFLGVFSFAATKLDRNILLKILTEFNSKGKGDRLKNLEDLDLNKFFLGEYVDDEYIEPEFKKVLDVKYGKDTIDQIIRLVVDSLYNDPKIKEGTKEGFIKNIQEIFGFIRPDTYGVSLYGSREKLNQKEAAEKNELLKLKNKQIEEYYKELIYPDAINFHYGPRIKVEAETLEDFQDILMNNVELNKDVLTFERGVFIITSMKKSTKGVLVKGFKSIDGKKVSPIGIEKSVLLTKNMLIHYRKLQNIERVDIDESILKEEAAPLSLTNPGKAIIEVETKEVSKSTGRTYEKSSQTLPEDFIRKLIQRGSKIKYEYFSRKEGRVKEATGIVKAIYPGAVYLNKIKGRGFSVPYENIISFETLASEVDNVFTEDELQFAKRDMNVNFENLIEKLRTNFSEELWTKLKQNLLREDEITFLSVENGKISNKKGKLVEVLPEKLIVEVKNKKYEITYGDLIKIEPKLLGDFTDKTIQEKKTLLDSLIKLQKQTHTDLPIKTGDYIMVTHNEKSRYNQVIAVSPTHVFVMVKTSFKNDPTKIVRKIVAYKKSDINVMYTNSLSHFGEENLINIFNEYVKIFKNEKSVREAKYSYFSNYETAMDGDYFLFTSSNARSQIYKLIDKKNRYAVAYTPDGSIRYITLSEKDANSINVFITERDISDNDSFEISDINNFFLLTANSPDDPRVIQKHQHLINNGFELVPASYVIPKHKIEGIEILWRRSGNLNIGSVRFGKLLGTLGENDADITQELVNRINRERNYTGSNLYILQKGTGYIKRFNESLYEFILLDQDGNYKNKEAYPDVYLRYLSTNAYVSYAKSWDDTGKVQFSDKLYKVVSIDGEHVVLEYAGTNNNGKTIVIRRRENLKEAFSQKLFKAIYINKDSGLLRKLREDLGDFNNPIENIKKEDLISTVAERLKKSFGIDYKVVNYDLSLPEYKEFKGKKAWIQPDSEGGEPTVVFNLGKENSAESDLVHEYLHLLLLPLRYGGNRNSGLYEKAMLEFKKLWNLKSDNVFEIEEAFVNYLSKEIVNKGLVDVQEDLKETIYETLFMALEHFTDGKSFSWTNEVSLEALLLLPMKNIFKITKGVSKEMLNSNLVYFDANFRDWVNEALDNKKLTIKCN